MKREIYDYSLGSLYGKKRGTKMIWKNKNDDSMQKIKLKKINN